MQITIDEIEIDGRDETPPFVACDIENDKHAACPHRAVATLSVAVPDQSEEAQETDTNQFQFGICAQHLQRLQGEIALACFIRGIGTIYLPKIHDES